MHNEESILSVDEYGTKQWRNKDGEFHRIGGPAYESHNGDKGWFTKGRFHRIDGPAVEIDGYKVWYHCGEKHRIDGPAVYEGEVRQFYLRGVHFKTKDAFFEALTPEEKEIALFSENFLNA
jgi:hypothetical protein